MALLDCTKLMLCFGEERVLSRQWYNCALQRLPKRYHLLIAFNNLHIKLAFRFEFGLLLAVEILFQHTPGTKPKVDPGWRQAGDI